MSDPQVLMCRHVSIPRESRATLKGLLGGGRAASLAFQAPAALHRLGASYASTVAFRVNSVERVVTQGRRTDRSIWKFRKSKQSILGQI